MGLNFIQKTAKTHTTAWSAEYRRAAADVFGEPPEQIDRTYLATSIGRDVLNEGDCVMIRQIDARVLVYKGLSPVAEIAKASLDLRERLGSCYGILSGEIEETNTLAGVVSVHVSMERRE